MKFCFNCGIRQEEEDAKFCLSCGAQLAELAEQPAPLSGASPEPTGGPLWPSPLSPPPGSPLELPPSAVPPRITNWKQFSKVFFGHKAVVGSLVVLVLLILMTISAPLIAPYNPNDLQFAKGATILMQPNSHFWLGTDTAARDVLSRVIYGGRVSLVIGFAVIIISTLIGILLRLRFPNRLLPFMVLMAMQLSGVVLASFLGIGTSGNTADWWNMIGSGWKYLHTNLMLSLVPLLALMILLFCFSMVGDGLRDALNPRLRSMR